MVKRIVYHTVMWILEQNLSFEFTHIGKFIRIMKQMNFEMINRNGIFEYHFYPKDDELMIQEGEHFWNNKELWDDLCSINGYLISYEKYNINKAKTGENILLYMLLIWELSRNKSLFGVGVWHTDFIERILNQAPELVNWEYNLIHDDQTRIDEGFVKAESPVIIQYNKPINKTPTNKTGLFELQTYQELADLLKPADVFRLVNIYAVDDIKRLVESLKSSELPDTNRLLQDSDIFIALIIGEDLGYYDYLLIKSKFDWSKKLMLITDKLNKFVKNYIEGIKSIKNENQMIDLIESIIIKHNFRH